MKRWKHSFWVGLIGVILWAFGLPIRAELEGGSTALDRSTAELTARLILDKLRDDVLATPPEPSLLVAEMDQDPGKYTETEDARQKLLRHYRETLIRNYQTQAQKYLNRLSGERTPEAVFDAQFLKEANELTPARLEDRKSVV